MLMTQPIQPLSDDSKAIIRALPFVIVLVRPDAEFTIVEASEQYLQAGFVKRENLVGRPIFEVFPDNPADPSVNGIERLRNSFNAVMHTRMVHVMDVMRYDVQIPGKPDFLPKYWLATNIPVLDGQGNLTYIMQRVFDVTSFVEDGELPRLDARATTSPELHPISQALADTQRVVELLQEGENRRKHAETRAHEAGERLDLAVEAADLGTFYCPLPFREIFWNATCKRHFFLPEDAEVDIDLFFDRLHPDDRESVENALQAAISDGKRYDIEYRVLAPDGRCGWLRAMGKVYCEPGGTPVRFDGITIDISAQKQSEEELRQASRQKDEFLAMIAHEMRNPLAPISAAADLLMLPNVNQANVARTSQIISRQVKHMSALLDDLLDVSRVTRGMVTLTNEVWDARLIAAAALEQVKPFVDSKHHQMCVVLPPESALVIGDEKRLVQVIVNLLLNAAKYTPPSGRIELCVGATPDEVHFRVTDNGVGMEPEFIAQAFQLFVQSERTLDRSQGGLGLGLALVKKLVELHFGTVEASSRGLGQGSVFTVCLPRHAESERLQKQALRALDIPTLERTVRVMVVDDNSDAATLTGELLGALGYDAITETDAVRALEQARLVCPDAFILDIGMPGMDGMELARHLRAQPETARALLIAVSGYAYEEDRKKSMLAGFDHHLAKPFNVRDLAALLAANKGASLHK